MKKQVHVIIIDRSSCPLRHIAKLNLKKKNHQNNTNVYYTLSKKSIFIEKILLTDTTKNLNDRVILTFGMDKGRSLGF